MPEGFITIEKAAELREVSEDTIRYWCRQKWIKGAWKHGCAWVVPETAVMAFKPPKPGRKSKPTDEETDDDR